jgi:putative sterol carrier protein
MERAARSGKSGGRGRYLVSRLRGGWRVTSELLHVVAPDEGRGSRPVRVLLGLLVTATHARGALVKKARDLAGMDGALNFVLTGEHPSAWHFWVRGGSAGFGFGVDAEARATVTLTEADFLRLIRGELEWISAGMLGKCRLDGDGGFMMVGGGVIQQLRGAIRDSDGDPRAARLGKRVLRRAMGLKGQGL